MKREQKRKQGVIINVEAGSLEQLICIVEAWQTVETGEIYNIFLNPLGIKRHLNLYTCPIVGICRAVYPP